MAAFNKDRRSTVIDRREEMADRADQPYRARTYTVFGKSHETDAERKARHAVATNTSPKMWR